MRPNRETRACLTCGKTFEVQPHQTKRFCSNVCVGRRAATRKADMIRQCEHCGKTYKRHAGRTKQRSCSNGCARRLGRETRQLNLAIKNPAGSFRVRGSTRAAKSATRTIREAHPWCNRCGWRDEPEVLHVHHRDRDRKNNRLANLEVLCPNCHAIDHLRAKDGPFSIRTGKSKKVA